MLNYMRNKIRFAIIGSGWRAMYYVRIVRALPKVFGLCGLSQDETAISQLLFQMGEYVRGQGLSVKRSIAGCVHGDSVTKGH